MARGAAFFGARGAGLLAVLWIACLSLTGIAQAQGYTTRPFTEEFGDTFGKARLRDLSGAYPTEYPTVEDFVKKQLEGKSAANLPDWTKRFDRGYDTPKDFHDLDKKLINEVWDDCFDIIGILDARGQPTCCVCVGESGAPVFSPIYEYWFPVSKVSNVRVKLEKPYVKKDDIKNIIRPTLDSMYVPTAERAYRNQINWMAKVASTQIATRAAGVPTPLQTPIPIPTAGDLSGYVQTARAVATIINKDANYRNMVPENSYVYNYPHVMVEPWGRSYDPEKAISVPPSGTPDFASPDIDKGLENCMEQSIYGKDDGKYWTDDRVCHWNLPWIDPKDSWAGDFPIGFQPSFNSTADNFARTSRDRLRTNPAVAGYDHAPAPSSLPTDELKKCFYKGGTIANYMAQFESNVFHCTEYYMGVNTWVGISPRDMLQPILQSRTTGVRALSNTGCGRKGIGRLVPTSDAAITRYPTMAAIRGTWIGAKLGYYHFPPDGACYQDGDLERALWDDSYGTGGGPALRGALVWPWTELILGQESCFDPTRHMKIGQNAFNDFEPDAYAVSGAIQHHPSTKDMTNKHIGDFTPKEPFDPLVHYRPGSNNDEHPDIFYQSDPICNPMNYIVAADKVLYRSPGKGTDDFMGEWRGGSYNGKPECLSMYNYYLEPDSTIPNVTKFVTRHEFDDDEHLVGIIWRFFRTCPKCAIGGKRRIPGTCTAFCAPRCGCKPDGTCCCPPFKML